MQKLGFQSAISAIDRIRDFDSSLLESQSQYIGEGIIVSDVKYFFEYYSQRLFKLEFCTSRYADFVANLLLNVIEKNVNTN